MLENTYLLLLVSIIVLVSASCAPKVRIYNLKPGGTPTEFYTDLNICAHQVGLDKVGGFVVGPSDFVAVMGTIWHYQALAKMEEQQECMEDLGYICTEECTKKK